jgi:spore maturation protein CgeB
VSYLPFAYAPDVHFPQPPASDADRRRFDADVMFAGGADPDRVRLLGSLIRAGLRVALYGGYWDRFPETRDYARGMLAAAELRMATAAAKVCVCLVRRANRDGHSMRSYEIPAMRGCVLAEDTDDHRALFGSDGAAAVLFSDVDDAVDRVRRLASDANRCAALAEAAHRRITSGGETYADRLTLMIRVAEDGESVPSAPAMSASQ